MKTTALLLALQGIFLASLSAQTVPGFLNYQGRVTDSTGAGLGTPTPENRKIVFRIYDAASAGNLLWTEEQTVTVGNGVFSVLLGQGIPFSTEPRPTLDTVFAGATSTRFLGITVDNGDGTINGSDAEVSPRQQITSTAFAFRAATADSIATGSNLVLNNSADYGLGYYGAGRPFGGIDVDGPVLFGLGGGALGSANGATQTMALRWNDLGQVGVGSATLTGMEATSKLLLQGDDSNSPPRQLSIRGETDTNKRLLVGYNTTGNYGSLQAYNGASTAGNLVLNPTGGNVGIGVVNPTFKLQIAGDAGIQMNVSGAGTAGLRLQANGTASSWSIYHDGGTDHLNIRDSITGATRILVRGDNGYVGIGTDTPGVPLDVKGLPVISHGANASRWFNKDTALTTIALDAYTSIRSEWFIQAFGFVAVSDQRIKDVVCRSDAASDLELIQKLQVTDYRMVDTIQSGESVHKGFIAQEVEALIPEAVNKGTNFVPTIYQKAASVGYDSRESLATLSLENDHDLEVGDLVRMMDDNGVIERIVKDVPSRSSFTIETQGEHWDRLFVYGKQVDDFRSVDYDRIFTTAVSALQQLKKEKDQEVGELKAVVETMESRLAAQAKELADLRAKDAARDAKLVAIETLLKSMARPPVQTAALKAAE